MSTQPMFRNAFALSLAGHALVLALFGVTFGTRMAYQRYSKVNFFGSALQPYDLASRPRPVVSLNARAAQSSSTQILLSRNTIPAPLLATPLYNKPSAGPSVLPEKEPLRVALSITPPTLPRHEPVLTFHPSLPYGFRVYFQDRQAVHIELMYTISSSIGTRSVSVRRKISSGDLEADLLTMRYITHYLSVEGGRFPSDTWQTVRIDLSPQEE